MTVSGINLTDLVYLIDMSESVLSKDIKKNYRRLGARYFVSKYGVSLGRVFTLASRLKVSVNQSKRLKEITPILIKAYEGGMTLREMAGKFRTNRLSLVKYLKLAGVRIRSVSESHRIYDVNRTYFDKIDTPEKAYWLGFLYADGCVTERITGSGRALSLTLGNKDGQHVFRFKRAIESTHPIHKNNRFTSLFIAGDELFQSLGRAGMHPRKSLDILFPPSDVLPTPLAKHFILGYFDGDGSISVQKKRKSWMMNIIGTETFLLKVRDYMVIDGLPPRKLHQEKRKADGKLFYLNQSGALFVRGAKVRRPRIHSLIRLYRFLYTDSPVWLPRKRKLFEKALRHNYGPDWKTEINKVLPH